VRSVPAFWDASALLPLCVNQGTSPQARAQYKKSALVVWWGSFVEVHSALCRLHREKQISDRAKQGASERLQWLSRAWREVLPGDQVREMAVVCLDKYTLRAADGLQLAASLVWCGEHPSKRSFICADHRLAQAAGSAGFSVIELLTATS